MMAKTWINLIAALVLLIASFGSLPLTQSVAQAATIIHVKPGGSTGAGCGTTWATACELQTALADASAGDEIWVAAGTYKPGTNREDTFQLKSGVALYGGFAGTETGRNQRDWDANLTVLSGDIGVPDDSSDNSYHVVSGDSVDDTAILDGFTVTAGNANAGGDGSIYIEFGGGMFNVSGSPSLVNLTFIGNIANYSGGGLYNENSDPTLTTVIFKDNQAAYGGGMANSSSNPFLTNVTFLDNSAFESGGMDNVNSSPVLINVTFSSNTAYDGGGMSNYENSEPVMANVTFIGNSAENGGGMYNSYSNPLLVNVIFSGNYGDYDGGGMYNYASSPSLTNVTIGGNLANYYDGGGIYNDFNSNPTIANTILWGNAVNYQSGPQIYNDETSTPYIRYSNVQGGCAAISGNDCSGGGNIDGDPLFVSNPDPGPDGTWGTADDDYGNLRLKYGSPAIDAGDNTAPGLAGITTDLDGNTRFYDVPEIVDTGIGPPPVVDMGAYEAFNVRPLEIYLPLTIR